MKSCSILLVDDDLGILEVVKTQLESQGHRVTAVVDGTQALAAMETGPFDLVVTDVFFPGRDGIEVIIERGKNNPATRIIAMSGSGKFSSDHYLLLVKKLGADVILKKPFRAQELSAAIETAFAL